MSSSIPIFTSLFLFSSGDGELDLKTDNTSVYSF